MAARTEQIGRESAPFQMCVEWGKIREFARATGSRHADYLDRRDAPVPPTFLTTMGFWIPSDSDAAALLRDLGLDLARVLHGEEEYVFHGEPPRAGTELTVTRRVDDVFEKEGKRGGTMTFAVIVTEFRDPDGRLVAEARTTIIETAKPPTQEG
jgi:hypothetical protein